MTHRNMYPLGIRRPSEIKETRIRLGLTQAKLAELAGVTQAYIAKIEAGEADPRFSTLERITAALEKFSFAGPPPTTERITSSPVVFVRPRDTVEEAIRLMETKNISQLPVITAGRQVGSISETTLLHHMASGKEISILLKQRIAEVMDKPFPTVAKDERIETIYPLLERNPAVLVTEAGRIIGIVTKADLFKLRGGAGQNLSPPETRE
jgi:predicted transcriptional regulator